MRGRDPAWCEPPGTFLIPYQKASPYMAVHVPRSVALQALLYCDQLEAEIEQGNSELVRQKLQEKFQGWLDNFQNEDALVSLKAIRAFANEVLNEQEE